MADPTIVETYRFRPADLVPSRRAAGISAFIRTRNGADFIEAAIRSHIDHFDEIVAVHNQCTDETPAILARLQHEFGDRLRVFDYRPRVYPPGSIQHATEPPDSPHSLVNYYNFALAQTRFRTALKLDDDHIAAEPYVADVTQRIRSEGIPDDEIWCFSGINLALDGLGRIGVPSIEPVVGLGDHAFFNVSATTYFHRDPRFEKFHAPGRRRKFVGVLYWHLKYLKRGHGFENYELESGDNVRYGRKRDRYLANRRVFPIAELQREAPGVLRALRIALPTGKRQLKTQLWRAIADGVTSDEAMRSALSGLDLPTHRPAVAPPARRVAFEVPMREHS